MTISYMNNALSCARLKQLASALDTGLLFRNAPLYCHLLHCALYIARLMQLISALDTREFFCNATFHDHFLQCALYIARLMQLASALDIGELFVTRHCMTISFNTISSACLMQRASALNTGELFVTDIAWLFPTIRLLALALCNSPQLYI